MSTETKTKKVTEKEEVKTKEVKKVKELNLYFPLSMIFSGRLATTHNQWTMDD